VKQLLQGLAEIQKKHATALRLDENSKALKLCEAAAFGVERFSRFISLQQISSPLGLISANKPQLDRKRVIRRADFERRAGAIGVELRRSPIG
jgi:hypothetical protein